MHNLGPSLSQPYFHGFDYLRAVMSVAIVAWHIQLFGASNLFDLKNFAGHDIVLSDVINFVFILKKGSQGYCCCIFFGLGYGFCCMDV